MNYRIASLYSKNFKKSDIVFDDCWSIKSSLQFLFLLLVPKKNYQTYRLTTKFIPGNRFKSIQKINKLFINFLIRRIITQKQPLILWIYHTEYYNIHNRSQAKILVLSCDKKYLRSTTPQMCYREQFAKGWVFVYILEDVPKPLIFKNKSQRKIIAKLKKINDNER